jgi:thymidine kinase
LVGGDLMNNEFLIFVGPMFGGKTSKLLSAIDRYKYQGKNIHVFKPSLDERYSKAEVVTHWGAKVPATRINSDTMNKVLEPFFNCVAKDSKSVLAFDEAFMIDGVGENLIKLFTLGHTILVSSLQLSSDFTPYKEIEKIMPYATKIEICPAVCSKCDLNAYYTEKIAGRSDHEIEVGGSEMYQPKCFKHFSKLS